MKIWKKNLVAAAVLLTVCGGIYANWVYSNEQNASDLVDTLNAIKGVENVVLVQYTQEA